MGHDAKLPLTPAAVKLLVALGMTPPASMRLLSRSFLGCGIESRFGGDGMRLKELFTSDVVKLDLESQSKGRFAQGAGEPTCARREVGGDLVQDPQAARET